VYHLATSGGNPLDIRRAVELTGLAHRRHHRQSGGRQSLRNRFDAIPVSKSRYIAFSAPAQKAVIRALNRIIASTRLPTRPLVRAERDLDKLQKLIALYEPFLLYNEQVFEAENIRLLNAALVDEEHETFGYNAEALDWWDYWLNVHIPGLRRWVFPLIEGKVPDTGPPRPLKLPAAQDRSPAATPDASTSVYSSESAV